MEEPNNLVKISIKKSSSKDGLTGYDLLVQTDGKIEQKELNQIAEKALTTAILVKGQLESRC